jgi:hypothetical protein
MLKMEKGWLVLFTVSAGSMKDTNFLAHLGVGEQVVK